MKHLIKYADFQSGSGRWYTNDPFLKGDVGEWWLPARLLNISLEDFILKIKNDFKADRIVYCKETDCLVYSWTNYNDCHKFTLWINRMARNGNWEIEV